MVGPVVGLPPGFGPPPGLPSPSSSSTKPKPKLLVFGRRLAAPLHGEEHQAIGPDSILSQQDMIVIPKRQEILDQNSKNESSEVDQSLSLDSLDPEAEDQSLALDPIPKERFRESKLSRKSELEKQIEKASDIIRTIRNVIAEVVAEIKEEVYLAVSTDYLQEKLVKQIFLISVGFTSMKPLP